MGKETYSKLGEAIAKALREAGVDLSGCCGEDEGTKVVVCVCDCGKGKGCGCES